VSVAGGDESAIGAGQDSYFDTNPADSSTIDHGDPTLDYKKIMIPGGFRRNFIARQQGTGNSGTTTPDGRSVSGAQRPGMPRATSSFVEFLSLYGHFGGEDLEEIEEEDEEEDEEEALRQAERGIPHGTLADRHVDENTPLLKRQDTRARIARKRLSMKGERGNATVGQVILMLIKGETNSRRVGARRANVSSRLCRYRHPLSGKGIQEWRLAVQSGRSSEHSDD
jgi:proton-coupled amino acid transporter